MPMCNLIEHSDNYSDTLGSLWQFKRYEIINNANVTNEVLLVIQKIMKQKLE